MGRQKARLDPKSPSLDPKSPRHEHKSPKIGRASCSRMRGDLLGVRDDAVRRNVCTSFPRAVGRLSAFRPRGEICKGGLKSERADHRRFTVAWVGKRQGLTPRAQALTPRAQALTPRAQ